MINQRDLTEMVVKWLSAGGLNDRETMLDILDDESDVSAANRMIEDWCLARVSFGLTQSWMRHNGVYRDDITRAVKRVRAEFDDFFPSDGE